jgi:hypothetical protein
MAERRRIRTFEWSTAVIAAISFGAGLAVFLRDGAEKFVAILSNDLWLFSGMLPKMAAGCLIAVSRACCRARWSRVWGRSGVTGLLIAMVMPCCRAAR